MQDIKDYSTHKMFPCSPIFQQILHSLSRTDGMTKYSTLVWNTYVHVVWKSAQ
jgi:hypothetical protein